MANPKILLGHSTPFLICQRLPWTYAECCRLIKRTASAIKDIHKNFALHCRRRQSVGMDWVELYSINGYKGIKRSHDRVAKTVPFGKFHCTVVAIVLAR